METLRRNADREATKAARLRQTMHDIESKAFASYAADLKHQEELSLSQKIPLVTKEKESLQQKVLPISEMGSNVD